MIVVSDTSPISNLLLIGKLEILQQLFHTVIICESVNSEILQLEQTNKNISAYKFADWITIKQIKSSGKKSELLQFLDEGEAESIALSLEINCNLLLIDERIGSRIAKAEGLTTIGLVGVLILAKKKNVIPLIKPVLQLLITDAGFWIGGDLFKKILADCDE